MIRILIAFVLFALALTGLLMLRPKEQMLRVDAVPTAATRQPDFKLFAPCPLGPRNIPKRNERIA